MGAARTAPALTDSRGLTVRLAVLAEFPSAGGTPIGGPQVAVGRLVRELGARGVEVAVVAPAPDRSDERTTELAAGVQLVEVPAGRRLTLARAMQPWRRHAASVVERMRPDVVHGQGLLPGGVAAADVRGLAPVVVTARGNAKQDTLAEYNGLGGWARASVRDLLARRAVAGADIVVGVNPDWTVNVPRPPRRFVYIPNMIDERFFGTPAHADGRRVLFAGGTRLIKGWPLLAAAWPLVLAEIPAARLDVVNWPSERPLPGVGRRELASIEIAGPLAADELAARMARASALVIPSSYEVSPIVLAEAWAVGLPAVATPVGGIPGLATGAAVFCERRPDALAAAIVSVLRRGPEIDALVAEGRRRAEAHRPEAVVAAHLAVYEDLVGSRHGR